MTAATKAMPTMTAMMSNRLVDEILSCMSTEAQPKPRQKFMKFLNVRRFMPGSASRAPLASGAEASIPPKSSPPASVSKSEPPAPMKVRIV